MKYIALLILFSTLCLSQTAQVKVQDVGGQVYNVKAYGAKGTGLVNERAYIQAAIDSASAVGGQVFIPPGTYSITTALDLKDGVKLVGSGYGSSVIKKTANDNGAVITVSGKYNFEISGLTIRNSSINIGESGNAIDIFNGSHDGIISNCMVDSSWNGIQISGLETISGSNIGIHNNIVKDVGENCIGANVRGANGIRITDNHLYNFGIKSTGIVGAAIEYRGGSGGIISNNIMEDGYYFPEEEAIDGVRVEFVTESPAIAPRALILSGNVVRNISGHGFRIQFATDVVMSGNRIDSCKNGITILSSSLSLANYNNVIGNTITNCVDHGIFIVGQSGYPVKSTLVSNNIITSSGGSQVYVGYAEGNIFKNNLISDGAQQGIYDTDSKLNIYDGNTLTNNGTIAAHIGIFLTNADSAIISGGKIYHNRLVPTNAVFIDNLCSGVRLYSPISSGYTNAYANSSGTTYIPDPANLSASNTFSNYGNGFTHALTLGDSIIQTNTYSYYVTNSADGADGKLLAISSADGVGVARGGSIVMRGNEYPDADAGKIEMYGLNGVEIYSGASGVSGTFDGSHNLIVAGGIKASNLTASRIVQTGTDGFFATYTANTGYNLALGTISGTVAEGNHTHTGYAPTEHNHDAGNIVNIPADSTGLTTGAMWFDPATGLMHRKY